MLEMRATQTVDARALFFIRNSSWPGVLCHVRNRQGTVVRDGAFLFAR